MASIKAGIELDALFCLSGWQDRNTFWVPYIIHNIQSSFTYLIFNVDGDHEPHNYTTNNNTNNEGSQSNQDNIL
jgi:hypothetical protein